MLTKEKYSKYIDETINHCMKQIEDLVKDEPKPQISIIVEYEKLLFNAMKERYELDNTI